MGQDIRPIDSNLRAQSWLRCVRWTTFLTGVPLLLLRSPLAYASSFDIPDPVVVADATKRLRDDEPLRPLDRSTRSEQGASQTPLQTRVQYAPPEGFEDLDGPVQTFFDLYYLDKRIGLYEGTLDGGRLVFSNPGAIALKLPDVLPNEVQELLSQPLDSHESLRCLPGDQAGCGTLGAGQSGVVVDPERFRINLFLGREYLSTKPRQDILLGNPVSGPSLIQNIAGSISSSSQASDSTRFGLVLDTYASHKKTSVVSRITADDSRGFRWQEAYAQHYFSNARVAAGLIQEEGSANLDSSMFYGAEISSFDRRDRSRDQSSGTLVDVVLPTASRVEIYRNGTLVSARQYPAGLQILDTNNLPIGSYPIRIVARDASGILLDETRTFSKTPDLPPAGETNFTIRAGVRATEGGRYFAEDEGSEPFLPESTGETIISASATRRLSQSTAATLGVTAVEGEIYPEAEFQVYKGDLRAVAALAIGPDNQYSAVANVNFRVGDVISSLSARQTDANPIENTDAYDRDMYRPFFQSESSVFGSVSMPVYGGSLGLRAGYSESDLADQRETFGLSYTRPFRNPRFGNGILAFDAVSSTEETRLGVRLTFRRSAGRNASVNGAVGFDYSQFDSELNRASRSDPLAVIGYTRSGQYMGAAVSGNVNAGTSNGDTSLVFDGVASSRRGEFDIATGVSQARGEDEAELFLASNIQTGFVYGDSKLHVGTLGFGNAAVLVDVPEPQGVETSGEGQFRVVVGNQDSASVKVGQSASILVPSLTNARVGIVPEGAPPFDVDLTPRDVPLYPGNVVRMTWQASYVISVIGRLVDAQGNPLANAIVQTSSDLAVTNREGYFSVSGKVDDEVRVRTYDGRECGSVAQLESQASEKKYLNLGDIYCSVSPALEEAKIEDAPRAGAVAETATLAPSQTVAREPARKTASVSQPFDRGGAASSQPSPSGKTGDPIGWSDKFVKVSDARRQSFRRAGQGQGIHFLMGPVARFYIEPRPRPISVDLDSITRNTDTKSAGRFETGRCRFGGTSSGTLAEAQAPVWNWVALARPISVRTVRSCTLQLEKALAHLERLKSAFDQRDLPAMRHERRVGCIPDAGQIQFPKSVFTWPCPPSGLPEGKIAVTMKDDFILGL